jgi:hypothetical protein
MCQPRWTIALSTDGISTAITMALPLRRLFLRDLQTRFLPFFGCSMHHACLWWRMALERLWRATPCRSRTGSP